MPGPKQKKEDAEPISSSSGIYGLCLSGQVFYVGQAKNISKRYAQHCSINQNRGKRPVNIWLTDLALQGIKPEISIIEATDDLNSREIYWISHYRSLNRSLLNVSDGGQSMLYLKRAKQDKPWANTHSPVQRRLKGVREAIRTFRRLGRKDLVIKFEERIIQMNDAINKVGLARMNDELWYRHGK